MVFETLLMNSKRLSSLVLIDCEIFFNDVCVSILLPFTCAIAFDNELLSASYRIEPIPFAFTSIYSIVLENAALDEIKNTKTNIEKISF